MRLFTTPCGALVVVAKFTRAAVAAEDKMDVTFGVDDHGGAAVVVDFVVSVLRVLFLAHQVDACFKRAGP